MVEPVFEPLHVELPGGSLAAVIEPGGGQFTVVLLHDIGADLDAMVPLLASLSLAEARLIALDLPGHGLSGDCVGAGDDLVADWLCLLQGRGWAPIILVAAGETAPLAWRLAARARLSGLCLISPAGNPVDLDPLPRSMPLLAFIASASPERMAEWRGFRDRIRGKWLSVSTASTHAQLVSIDPTIRGQLASHLAGFAQEAYALSLRTG